MIQATLFGGGVPRAQRRLGQRWRTELGQGAWLDYVPRWVAGHETLFDALVSSVSWEAHSRMMFDSMVAVPRLLGVWPPKVVVPQVASLGHDLSQHYGVRLDRVSLALYRDGRDSVAWHGDRLGALRAESVVAIVSLGARRRFAIRAAGGGSARVMSVGEGDLVVMGGSCQEHFEHCVPKVSAAEPRIALMFRHSQPMRRA